VSDPALDARTFCLFLRRDLSDMTERLKSCASQAIQPVIFLEKLFAQFQVSIPEKSDHMTI
jgi:hypothetical protein